MSCSLQYAFGRTPLQVAVEKGHTEIVDILLKGGASTHSWDRVRIDTCAYLYLCFKVVFII